MNLPHVVIVGGGFAGLYAAKAFARAQVRVTLIDKHTYHMFRPLMYQVETGILSADEIAAPLRSIFRSQSNIDVRMGEVTGIDTKNQIVRVEPCDLQYDYLVLATGIRSNYFGHDGWKEFAPSIDSLDGAETIRRDILMAFDYRRYQHDTVRAAAMAKQRGATLIAFTDPYLSPLAAHADIILTTSVQSPSPFGALTPAVALVEALVTGLVDLLGDRPLERMARYDSMYAGFVDAGDRAQGEGT